jgi:hypothetical protein
MTMTTAGGLPLESLPPEYWQAIAAKVNAAKTDKERVEITADAFARFVSGAPVTAAA